MFSTEPEKLYVHLLIFFDIISLFASELEEPKIGLSGKGLKIYMWNRQPFPKRQILDLSKQKEFADDNFKFDKNGKKF